MSKVLGKDVRDITASTGLGKAGTAAVPILTLADTSVTAASYGTATAVPTLTIDAQGRITNASPTTITAPTLATARTIGGVSFDGSANIDLPGVNAAGNQNTTGSAATLTTARLIGGVSFNGSANIDLPGVNAVGNQNTTGSAATLTTARNINGVAFNGSADITIPKGGRVSLIQDGALETFTGTARWYAHAAITVTNITARANTAPVGSSLNIALKKTSGGSTTTTNIVIADGSTKQEDASPSLSLAEDDYLTVDITQVGSSTAGSDLVVTLMYTY